jgi:hypothetical protein
MSEITYEALSWPVRNDIVQAHRRQWARLGKAGTWLTGEERIAIAAEARHALDCSLCQQRKDALSPYAIDGEHDHLGVLPHDMVEQVHRIRTDPGRLTKDWYKGLIAGGMNNERYVETIGVIADVVAIDTFCRGVGMAPWPLPQKRISPGYPLLTPIMRKAPSGKNFMPADLRRRTSTRR